VAAGEGLLVDVPRGPNVHRPWPLDLKARIFMETLIGLRSWRPLARFSKRCDAVSETRDVKRKFNRSSICLVGDH
jgi:hypothetical protein